MSDWKQRARTEKEELDEKIGMLDVFLDSHEYEFLPAEAQELLLAQIEAMNSYSSILGKRLAG